MVGLLEAMESMYKLKRPRLQVAADIKKENSHAINLLFEIFELNVKICTTYGHALSLF